MTSNATFIGIGLCFYFVATLTVCKSGADPVSCKPTNVGVNDDCHQFAPSKRKAVTECQESLKDATYLKICIFVGGTKLGFTQSTPEPKERCQKVNCDHPCYIPCVYFVARNRSVKTDPAKEYAFTRQVTYECESKHGETLCGCAAVSNYKIF